jgi:hypothetical protein
MVDLTDIQQALQITTDSDGNPVVQIPLDLWKEWLSQNYQPQREQLLSLLDEWEKDPDEQPDEWWQDFDTFLRENRWHLS